MIKNFYLKNIIVHAQTAGTIEYAENWTIEDVEIVTADRLPITISNCENVSFSTSGKNRIGLHLSTQKQNHISILAAEFPDFIFHLPEMAGNLKFGIVKDGESKWIKDAEQIKSDLKNQLTYRIADPLLNKGEITFKAISLKNTNGILIEVSAKSLTWKTFTFFTPLAELTAKCSQMINPMLCCQGTAKTMYSMWNGPPSRFITVKAEI